MTTDLDKKLRYNTGESKIQQSYDEDQLSQTHKLAIGNTGFCRKY